jgi:hypothetical protein
VGIVVVLGNKHWLVLCLLLAACAGASSEEANDGDAGASTAEGISGPGEDRPATEDTGDTDVVRGSPPIGSAIVEVGVEAKAALAEGTPVTFGHVFRRGDVPAGANLEARAGNTRVALQVDAKATHGDGSLRHAVVTAVLPEVGAGNVIELELVSSNEQPTSVPLELSALLEREFDFVVTIEVGGVEYSASPRDALAAEGGAAWLSGPLVSEWTVVVPFAGTAGSHDNLAAHFDVRAYRGLERVRVDFTLENTWAFAEQPQGYEYDVLVSAGGVELYTKRGLVHHPRARWHKAFWLGNEAPVELRFDSSYLISTGAVPNYDPELTIARSALESFAAEWSGEVSEPMGNGLLRPYMPETGGRRDIGILPSWAVIYALSMDPRARLVTLGTADAAGSFGVHYRDEQSGRPVSLDDYPDLTILGNPSDTSHPFAECSALCDTPYTHDSAHQPSMAFIPYVVTGDRYYLEEQQFWANYNLIQHNPSYRDGDKGLFKSDQVRGQAWSLRTLAQTAFITPDSDPLKSYFENKLSNNIEYYVDTWVDANALGLLADGYAFSYNDGLGVAPWQDDFFTSAIGYLMELGYSDAAPLLAWKARFPVGRMNDPGYCWIHAAPYALNVRATVDGALFETFGEVYQVNFAALTNSTATELGTLSCASDEMANWLTQADEDSGTGRSPWVAGEMTGYADSAEGYPSNLQVALAMAVDSKVEGAEQAWETFMNRAVKPDYSSEPQFAIVPRTP